jgi:nucleotide-binding universal stress UspA family protein
VCPSSAHDECLDQLAVGKMSFRDVLVVLRAYPATTPAPAVEHAAAMAVALKCRLSVIACGIKPHLPGNILGNAIFNVSALVAEEGRKSVDDARRLLAEFEKLVGRHDVACRRILETCRSSDVPAALVDHARLRDLTILPMPKGPYVSQLDAQWYAETMIFDSGHPVIVLPQDRENAEPVAFDTVMVAWDKGRAASRAIADAMPILRLAKRTYVLTVLGEKPIASRRSGRELAEHLAVHGVDVSLKEVDAAGRTIGKVLEDEVKASRVDLLVMGAYGRSRLKEFILGGATKSMLTDPPTSLFMSH